jgi:hypothetical protein
VAQGGVGDLAPGDRILMHTTFAPGTYRLSCYFQNKGESQNHAERGMQKVFTVD